MALQNSQITGSSYCQVAVSDLVFDSSLSAEWRPREEWTFCTSWLEKYHSCYGLILIPCKMQGLEQGCWIRGVEFDSLHGTGKVSSPLHDTLWHLREPCWGQPSNFNTKGSCDSCICILLPNWWQVSQCTFLGDTDCMRLRVRRAATCGLPLV